MAKKAPKEYKPGQHVIVKTVEWAERCRRVHLKPFFGGMQAKNVGTDTLSRYIESRRAEQAANGTINRELFSAAAFFHAGL